MCLAPQDASSVQHARAAPAVSSQQPTYNEPEDDEPVYEAAPDTPLEEENLYEETPSGGQGGGGKTALALYDYQAG